MPLTALYDAVKNSVVHVISLDEKQNIRSSGTGSLVDPRLVLTCEHCVMPNTRMAVVDPKNPKGVIIGDVIYAHAATDIALIQFQQDIGTPVEFSSSSTCAVGNGAFVVGFPMNIPEQTLMSAHIASITSSTLRIDVSVNHGNSGGPLFNLNGQQLGVVNAKHGSLASFLTQMETMAPGGQMNVGGFDAVGSIRTLISEMKRNLNLGIGYAIPTDAIRHLHQKLEANIPIAT